MAVEAEDIDTGGGELRILNFEFRILNFKIEEPASEDVKDFEDADAGDCDMGAELLNKCIVDSLGGDGSLGVAEFQQEAVDCRIVSC